MNAELHLSSYQIPLATGVDLHYVAKEPLPPQGMERLDEALLLIHGYSDSWRSFEEMLALLPVADYNVPVFALDMRGHGQSSSPGSYTQDAFAADIAAFMDALQIQKALVVGHSMGGLIAHAFAVAYPEKVKGLVLIATAATLAGRPLLAEMKTIVDTFADDEPAPVDFVQEFQASCFAEPARQPRMLYRYVSESLRLRGRVWKETLDGMLQEDHRDRLPQVSAPALVLWGEQDSVVSRPWQEELVALLPDARLMTIPGASHALNVERATEVVESVRVFIKEMFGDQAVVAQ